MTSANIHRRHLSAEQRRELIERLLKANPGQSDRQVAETVKADHKTVAAVRQRAETSGEIPQITRRTDRKGRSRPAHREKLPGKDGQPESVFTPADRPSPEAARVTARRAARRERKRRKTFDSTISAIGFSCENNEELELPSELSMAEIDDAIATIKASVAELNKLTAKLERVRYSLPALTTEDATA